MKRHRIDVTANPVSVRMLYSEMRIEHSVPEHKQKAYEPKLRMPKHEHPVDLFPLPKRTRDNGQLAKRAKAIRPISGNGKTFDALNSDRTNASDLLTASKYRKSGKASKPKGKVFRCSVCRTKANAKQARKAMHNLIRNERVKATGKGSMHFVKCRADVVYIQNGTDTANEVKALAFDSIESIVTETVKCSGYFR